jgi:hypothetical protein
VFFHLVVIADLLVEMIHRLQQGRHRATDRLSDLTGRLGGEAFREHFSKRPAKALLSTRTAWINGVRLSTSTSRARIQPTSAGASGLQR